MKICPNAVSAIYLNIVICISAIIGCPFGWRPVVSKGAMISCTSLTAVCKSLNAAYECKQARWAISASMFCCIKKDTVDDDRATKSSTSATSTPTVSISPESFTSTVISVMSQSSSQQSSQSTRTTVDDGRPSTATTITDINPENRQTNVVAMTVASRIGDELAHQNSKDKDNSMVNVGAELLHVGSELLHIGGELLHMGQKTNMNIDTINHLIHQLNATSKSVTSTTEEPVVTFYFTIIPPRKPTTEATTDKENNNKTSFTDNSGKTIILPSKVIPNFSEYGTDEEDMFVNNTITLIPRKFVTTTKPDLENSMINNLKNISLPTVTTGPDVEPAQSRDIKHPTSGLPTQQVKGNVLEENGADIWNSSTIFTTISTDDITKPTHVDFGRTSVPTYVNVTQLYVLPDGVTEVIQLIQGQQAQPTLGTRMIHYAAKASVTLLRTPNKNIIVDAGWPFDKYLLIDALRNQLHIKPAEDVDHVVITQERLNTIGAVNIFRAADIITPQVYKKGSHTFQHPAMAGKSWYLDDGILITPTAGIFGREISVLVKNAVHFGRVAIVGHLFSRSLSGAALVNIPGTSYKRRQRSRRKIICNVDYVIPIYEKMFKITKAMQKRHNCPTVERRR